MNNTCGFATERTMQFLNVLKNYVEVPITLIDERLITVEANNILLTNDMSRKKRKVANNSRIWELFYTFAPKL